MVEKSENGMMDDNENYLEVRKAPSLSWCRKRRCWCSCLCDFLINFRRAKKIDREHFLSVIESDNFFVFRFIAAFEDELLAVHDVVRQRECESVRKVYAKSSDTESGRF